MDDATQAMTNVSLTMGQKTFDVANYNTGYITHNFLSIQHQQNVDGKTHHRINGYDFTHKNVFFKNGREKRIERYRRARQTDPRSRKHEK